MLAFEKNAYWPGAPAITYVYLELKFALDATRDGASFFGPFALFSAPKNRK